MKQLRDHKAQGSALFTLVSGIVIVIAVIFFLIKLAGSGSFGDVNETTEAATQTRIQPVGQLKMGDGIPVGERQGDQIFNKICIQCHAADSIVPNVPKFENKGDWAPRIAQGFDTLFQHALNGFNAMPAKGGAADLTDQELKRVITYMANKAGGTFPDPDAAASADAAASGEAASAPAAEGAAPADAPKADAAKAEDKGAAASGADGKKVYEATCQACHGGAVSGIPAVGKKEDWAPRIKQGKDTLHKHAIEGFNAMPAKGGNGSLSDDEVKAAVDYMANQSGAKF
ncbi:cytochrome c5 family protein [Neisseria flavescens]|uniref:Cytochrome C n=1 Tax=Neisseria flavescens NRL30031/H210 TaxID=546264 RepID=C0ER85_NEIFL|nr:c-type cytochrome [Neisseria flavescens]SPY03628.1 cytochrome [Neisseria meningitidis]EEG32451.1 cytochrome C [Neisseria flavescens NRL30031/H210]QCL69099.1 cytochrome c5 family protein [Neisseria flavescens]SPY10528.1 cytochrome [Neisseria meningitidis]STZ64879.1 cytochrome [Neisseria flavescens]